MKVSCYRLQDLDEILKLRGLIAAAIEDKAFFNWPEDAFQKELAISKTWISQRKDSNQILGFILLREDLERLEIMILGTDPKARAQGVMSGLMQEIQLFAAQQNKEISLEVHEKNKKACQFYLKMGFKKLHSRQNYYRDGAAAEIYIWQKPML